MCLVDVGNTLTHIELGILTLFDTFNLNARLAAMLVSTIALVAEMHSLCVKSDASHCDDCLRDAREQGGLRL